MISLQNIIRKKKERLKQAPENRSECETGIWKALKTTGESSCMEVVMWTLVLNSTAVSPSVYLPLSVNSVAPGRKPATEIHFVCWIAL